MIVERSPGDEHYSEAEWLALCTDPGPRRLPESDWPYVLHCCRKQAYYEAALAAAEKALDALRARG